MSRRKLVAANWKMNLNKQQAIALAQAVADAMPEGELDVLLCPAMLHAGVIAQQLVNSRVSLGAQNCAAFENGAYTGEVSAAQLSDIGIQYVIIGHSERRQYFHESSADLTAKIKLALAYNLIPIYCVGEPLEQREINHHFDFVAHQLQKEFSDLSAGHAAKCIIAYEPVWAIGTGKTATTEQAQEMHAFIRAQVADWWGQDVARDIRILYGGSCKAANAKQLFACPDVDGGLIGGASLLIDEFKQVMQAAI